MRRAIWLLAFLASSVLADGFDELDARKAFRGIEFGTKCTDIKDFELFETKGQETNYRRKNDKKQLGALSLSDVTYRCYGSRFYQAALTTDSVDESVSTLKSALGREPVGPDQNGTVGWMGENVMVIVVPSGAHAIIFFVGRQMDKLVQQYEKQQNQRAKDDF